MKKTKKLSGITGIRFRVVPHKDQRYNTVGDWVQDEKGELLITVSRMGNWKYEMLISLHELIEAALCVSDGVTAEEVDQFDQVWAGKGEPGDSPGAPYHKQHRTASVVERLVCVLMNVSWDTYGEMVDKVSATWVPKKK